MKNKKIIFLCLSFISFGNVVADEPPLPLTEFISNNGKYISELINTSCNQGSFMEEWQLKTIESNETKYYFECYQFSLSGIYPGIFISDDGENIVFADWFLGVDPSIDWFDYEEEPIFNSIVLRFYSNGKEIKIYRLSDLFNDINNGYQSASHLQWTRFNYDRSCIRLENNKLIITTYELYEYIFDISNGEIIKKNKIIKQRFTAARHITGPFTLFFLTAARPPQRLGHSLRLFPLFD
jgi:hypothetical protein